MHQWVILRQSPRKECPVITVFAVKVCEHQFLLIILLSRVQELFLILLLSHVQESYIILFFLLQMCEENTLLNDTQAKRSISFLFQVAFKLKNRIKKKSSEEANSCNWMKKSKKDTLQEVRRHHQDNNENFYLHHFSALVKLRTLRTFSCLTNLNLFPVWIEQY